MGMSIEEWKLNDRKDEYLRIGDIVERFNDIDEVYNHTPWTLEQIYSNLNILVGFETIPKDQYKADMVAMLEELKSYIELMASLETDPPFAEGEKYCAEIIQQKINTLKGEIVEDGNDR